MIKLRNVISICLLLCLIGCVKNEINNELEVVRICGSDIACYEYANRIVECLDSKPWWAIRRDCKAYALDN